MAEVLLSLPAGTEGAGTAVNERSSPVPHASLLLNILFGDDRVMPQDLADAFRRTEEAYIIAISGQTCVLVSKGQPLPPIH